MIVDKACFERGCACYDDRVDGPGVEVVKKEWVGLTDEEFGDCLVEGDPCEALAEPEAWAVMREVAAKLKEKNQ